MPVYQYEAMDNTGTEVKDSIEASNALLDANYYEFAALYDFESRADLRHKGSQRLDTIARCPNCDDRNRQRGG